MHRTRQLPIRQRVLINALPAHLADFGIVVAKGRAGIMTLSALVEDEEHELISEIARKALLMVVDPCSDASLFRSGRELAAWIGLVPRRSSGSGKERLRQNKTGDA